MKLDKYYQEKVYAGVLGKIIGVYLGRPFEQWSHNLIMQRLGKIEYYVNKKLNKPLVVTDDDITGTFTFLRALNDYNFDFNISSEKIGQTWLNNIVENETILWWGGVGESTEHTAFINLKNGIKAPKSGSRELNGITVSEQIGAQIFIDGWPMVCPGDPQKASELAARAGRVSHDGEAIYGAQVIAALESQAFIEKDVSNLLKVAKDLIPKTSVIYRMINEIEDWCKKDEDWMLTRKKIEKTYGYNNFSGGCHMVPNHALIIMSLIYGKGDFSKSMMIVNSSGWDTDCNSGNLGCILGIMNGLEAFSDGPDWREPIKDMMYCPTANGGETITDAVNETYKIINIAKRINNEKPINPKNGARFHFEMPGSLQGWRFKDSHLNCSIYNAIGNSMYGHRSLCIDYKFNKNEEISLFTNSFFPKELKLLEGEAKKTFFSYNFLCSPIIYSGQNISSVIKGDLSNLKKISCCLFLSCYGPNDKSIIYKSKYKDILPGKFTKFNWNINVEDGCPIYEIGLLILSDKENVEGKIYLDFISINGQPKTTFKRPNHVIFNERGNIPQINPAVMWRNSWVKATDHWTERSWEKAFKIGNNFGRGMIITGSNSWNDYFIKSKLTCNLGKSFGFSARVQVLERYYALEITKFNKLRLIKMLDGMKILSEIDFKMEFNKVYEFYLSVKGNFLKGSIDNNMIIEFEDNDNPLLFGGINLVVDSGTMIAEEINVNKK